MPTPRQVNWAKVRVFAMTVVALAILSELLYLLTNGTLLEKKTSLYLYIPDATGLASGTPVRADGIDVGKVDRIALSGAVQPDRIVRVTMTVERQKLGSIPADSFAQITADTLIGDKFIGITTGASRVAVRPNAEIVYQDNPDLMKRLDLSQFEKQLRVVDNLLTDIEQGRGLVGQFVQGTGMYDEWRKLLRETQTAVHAVAATTSTLGHQVYSDAEYQRLRGKILEVDQALARLQSGQGALGPMLRDDAQYQQVMAALGGWRQSVAGIQGSEFFQSDASYADWNRQIRALIRQVDDFNASPVMITSESYDRLQGMTRELGKTLRDFRENPRKYLRLKVF